MNEEREGVMIQYKVRMRREKWVDSEGVRVVIRNWTWITSRLRGSFRRSVNELMPDVGELCVLLIQRLVARTKSLYSWIWTARWESLEVTEMTTA